MLKLYQILVQAWFAINKKNLISTTNSFAYEFAFNLKKLQIT